MLGLLFCAMAQSCDSPASRQIEISPLTSLTVIQDQRDAGQDHAQRDEHRVTLIREDGLEDSGRRRGLAEGHRAATTMPVLWARRRNLQLLTAPT